MRQPVKKDSLTFEDKPLFLKYFLVKAEVAKTNGNKTAAAYSVVKNFPIETKLESLNKRHFGEIKNYDYVDEIDSYPANLPNAKTLSRKI